MLCKDSVKRARVSTRVFFFRESAFTVYRFAGGIAGCVKIL